MTDKPIIEVIKVIEYLAGDSIIAHCSVMG